MTSQHVLTPWHRNSPLHFLISFSTSLLSLSQSVTSTFPSHHISFLHQRLFHLRYPTILPIWNFTNNKHKTASSWMTYHKGARMISSTLTSLRPQPLTPLISKKVTSTALLSLIMMMEARDGVPALEPDRRRCTLVSREAG